MKMYQLCTVVRRYIGAEKYSLATIVKFFDMINLLHLNLVMD